MIKELVIFDKHISPYMIMVIIGAFVAGIFACNLTKKAKKDENDMIVLLLISAIGVFIGSHILYGFTNINELIRLITHFNKLRGFNAFISVVGNIFGGAVFYGGLIGGLIVGSIYIKKKKLNSSIFYDIGAIIIPLFHVFGRIGCFLSGCCFGVESHIGFTYHHSLIEIANGVRRFPIQLVESGYNLILFIILYILYTKEKFKGKLIYLYLILYPIGRFIFEFFRGDEYRGFILGLSTSQFISILLIIFSFISLIIKRKKDTN